jgi:hypothetical protein
LTSFQILQLSEMEELLAEVRDLKKEYEESCKIKIEEEEDTIKKQQSLEIVITEQQECLEFLQFKKELVRTTICY